MPKPTAPMKYVSRNLSATKEKISPGVNPAPNRQNKR
jgi:hypothetical protein